MELVCQPVSRAILRSVSTVQRRWSGSENCTPEKKRPQVDSMRAAPREGLRGRELEVGWRPAAMRPMVLAQSAVWGAAIPAAMVAAGGMEGWDRVRMMSPM